MPKKADKERRPWEVWDKPGVAERVDAYWRSPAEQLHRTNLASLVRRHLPLQGASVLEVGCGTGLVYQQLYLALGPFFRYRGVDNSPAMLAIAQARYPQADLRLADAFSLPYKDGRFDVAVAFEVFGHMPPARAERGVAELCRVAKQVAIFTMWLVDVKIPWEGPDGRWSYPRREVEKMVAAACPQGRLSQEELGLCTAFVVHLAGG